jgi:hypothetical protein
MNTPLILMLGVDGAAYYPWNCCRQHLNIIIKTNEEGTAPSPRPVINQGCAQ